MDGARLKIVKSVYGCCDHLIDREEKELGEFRCMKYIPDFIYVQPKVETEKLRILEGTAYIDFPVSRTEIEPGYRNNRMEIEKICATIDSVRNDSDVTIRSLSIKGFASPESPYSNNARLAEGRTAALKRYVAGLYHFPDSFIETSFEPEDWEGLRRYVEQSSLASKQEILEYIDSDEEPDRKEWLIKSRCPGDYRFLLDNCYPALRHSDYRIEYEVRSFTDAEEIRMILKKNPQKLSLHEFYIAAQELEQGSEEFCDIFEVAVMLYPDDEIANLNAANSAMDRGEYTRAARYLAKAGQSPEAVYARGVLAALGGEYDRAAGLFRQAADAGVDKAADAVRHVEDVKRYNIY